MQEDLRVARTAEVSPDSGQDVEEMNARDLAHDCRRRPRLTADKMLRR